MPQKPVSILNILVPKILGNQGGRRGLEMQKIPYENPKYLDLAEIATLITK